MRPYNEEDLRRSKIAVFQDYLDFWFSCLCSSISDLAKDFSPERNQWYTVLLHYTAETQIRRDARNDVKYIIHTLQSWTAISPNRKRNQQNFHWSGDRWNAFIPPVWLILIILAREPWNLRTVISFPRASVKIKPAHIIIYLCQRMKRDPPCSWFIPS